VGPTLWILWEVFGSFWVQFKRSARSTRYGLTVTTVSWNPGLTTMFFPVEKQSHLWPTSHVFWVVMLCWLWGLLWAGSSVGCNGYHVFGVPPMSSPIIKLHFSLEWFSVFSSTVRASSSLDYALKRIWIIVIFIIHFYQLITVDRVILD
jgi:hypothetical protein